MVPWPVAALSLWYAVVATAAAAALWRVAAGISPHGIVWPAVWLAVAGSASVGLPLLKPWARILAIVGSVLLTVTTLAVAAVLVRVGRPMGGVVAALSAGVHLVAIRYLQRPTIRVYFTK